MCCSRHVKGEKVQRTTFIHSPSKADVFSDCSTSFKLQNFNFFLSALFFDSSLPKRTRNMKFNFVLRETFPSLLPQLPLGSFIIDWTTRKNIGETEKKILQRTREKKEQIQSRINVKCVYKMIDFRKKHETPGPNKYKYLCSTFYAADMQCLEGESSEENFVFTDSLTFIWNGFSSAKDELWTGRYTRPIKDTWLQLLAARSSLSLLLLIRTHLRQVCRRLRLYYFVEAPNVCSVFVLYTKISSSSVHIQSERGDVKRKKCRKTLKFRLLPDSENKRSGPAKEAKKKKCNDTTTTEKRGRTSQHRHRLSRGKWARCLGCSRPKKFIELFLISLSSRCFYFLLWPLDSPGSPYRISIVIKFHFCAKNFTILKSFKLMRHDTMTTWDVCASKRGWCNCKPTSDDNHCNQRNDVATPWKLETKGDWRCRSVTLKEFWRLTRQIASKNIGETTISIAIKLAYLDWDITIFSHRKSLMVMAEFYSN